MAEAGNTIDESIALVTGANTVVQNPEQVGTALKTLALRLRGAKVELEEAGLETENMAESTATLQAKLKALTHGKVDIMLDADTFKSTTQILREMAAAWEHMTDIERASALELMGGKRQANILSSLIANFDTVENVITTSANSANSALEENAKYLDSMQGRIDQLTNSLQSMWVNALDSDWMKMFISLADIIVQVTDKVGLLNVAIAAFMGKTAFSSRHFGIIQLLSKIPGLANIASAAMKALGKSFGAFSGIATATASIVAGLAITALWKLADAYIVTAKEAAEAAQEAANTSKELREQNNSLKEYKDQIIQLRQELDSNTLSESDAYDARSKLLTIQDELIDKFGLEKDDINLVTGAINEQIAAIDELSRKKAQQWINNSQESINGALEYFGSDTQGGYLDPWYEGFQSKIDMWGQTQNVIDMIDDYASKHDNIITSQGALIPGDQSISFTGSVEEVKSAVEDFQIWLGKKEEELSDKKDGLLALPDQTDDVKAQIESIENDIEQLKDVRNDIGKEHTNWFGDGSMYAANKAIMEEAQYNTAITKYADQYMAILDAQNKLTEAQAKGDPDGIKTAIANYRDAINNAMNDANEWWMDDYFNSFTDGLAEQEFTINIKANENGLKDQLSDIIQAAGDQGLSALDDNQIKDLLDRYKSGEFEIGQDGSPVDYSTYTKEQVDGIVALQAEADKAGISIESLISILTNFGLIAGRPIEKTVESVSIIGKTYSALVESVEEYNDVLSKTSEIVADNTEVSQEYVDSLKALGIKQDDLNECFDDQNPLVVKNAKALNDLVKTANKNVATNVKLAKSNASLDYYKLVKQINDTLNSTNNLDDANRNALQTTFKQIDALEQSIYKYQLLEDSLLGATNAFTEFNKAQEIDELNTYGDDYIEMLQTLYNGIYKTGEVGTEAYKVARDAFVPADVYQGYDNEADRMEAQVKYLNEHVFPKANLQDDVFSLDYLSAENFVNDLREAGVVVGDLESFDLVEGMNLKEAEKLLKEIGKPYSETELYAHFANLDKYNTGSEQSFLSQLDTSIEGRITNITSEIEELNRQKLALLEDDGYEKNKVAIDEINQKLANSQSNLNDVAADAYVMWQSYTKNEAALSALGLIEDKQRQLTKDEANTLGINWDEVKGKTVQEAIDYLLGEKLKLEETTVLTAQFAIDHIDSQIDELEAKLKEPKTLKIEAEESGKTVDDIKAEIEQKIQALKEEKVGIATEFGIELTEEDKKELEDELNAIEKFKINDKEFTVVAKGTSEVMKLLEAVNEYAQDVTKTVTTVYKTVGSSDPQYSGWTHTEGGGRYTMANGTAHANGTAYKGGSWGAPRTETALVGELGPEMLVRNGRWTTVGENGAEFTQVKKGDIIFNHKQTEDLLSKGYVTGRGKAYASGTAYAGLYEPLSPNNSLSNTPGNTLSSSSSGSLSDDAEDAADEFREVFDWIAVRIEEINERIDLKSANLENAIGSTNQNAIIDDMIDLNEKLYDNLLAGADRYYSYAQTLLAKIPSEYREAAQNGTIAIEEFVGEVDEETLNAIQEYRDWVQKGADATQQAEEVLTEISSLAKQAIDNIADEYDNKSSIRNNEIDQLDAYNALLETKYGSESSNIYKEIIAETNKNIATIEEQRNKMQSELNEQVNAGNIKKYSQDWYDAINDIAALDTEIIELTKDTYDYQDAINEIRWDNFDTLMKQYEMISDEAENLIDILGNKDAVNELGEWTDEGVATLGLYAHQMENAEMQAKQYKEEIDHLNKNWESMGLTQQEYIEKLDELKSGQYDAIKAYNDTKDAIVDLNKERVDAIKNGIEKEIEAYEELINTKKKALEAEKDAVDFQRSIEESTKEISDIERQIAALSADNSASARSKRAKLEAELLKAQQDLQDKYYDRSIQDQQDALDKELESFQKEKDEELEGWDKYLENTEQVVSDSLSIVQSNTEKVYATLKSMGQEYSLNISAALTSPWKDGEDALQSYFEKFGLTMSSTVDKLQEVADEYKTIMNDIEDVGTDAVNKVNTNTNKYQAEKQSVDMTTTEGQKTAEKTIKVGGKINAGSAKIYESAGDSSGEQQYYSADPIYKVLSIDGDWVQVRHHKLSTGVTGWFRKSQVKAYAKGTVGVKNDQLALIDELGDELVMHADSSGKLAFLSKGSAVIPHDISENLMQLGELNPQDILDRNRPTISAPHITNNNIELNVSFGEVVHIDHVDNNAVPNLAKTVEKQIDKYMKGLNAEIRKYVR